MAYISWEAVKKIWYRTPYSNWRSLMDTIAQYLNGESDIDKNTAAIMYRIVRKLYYANYPFPSTPDDLYQIINQYWE